MNKFLQFVKATLIGGVWFLVPLAVLAMIFSKVQDATSRVVVPIADLMPIETIFGLGMERILAIVAIVVFCFLAGLLAKTDRAKRAADWLEVTLLSNVPGYDFMKAIAASRVGLGRHETGHVVLARIEDSWQIGFITETLENGLHAVFVPGAPVPWSGDVYFMSEDRFKRLTISYAAAMKCLRRLGVGSKDLLEEHLLEAPAHPNK